MKRKILDKIIYADITKSLLDYSTMLRLQYIFRRIGISDRFINLFLELKLWTVNLYVI